MIVGVDRLDRSVPIQLRETRHRFGTCSRRFTMVRRSLTVHGNSDLNRNLLRTSSRSACGRIECCMARRKRSRSLSATITAIGLLMVAVAAPLRADDEVIGTPVADAPP